MSLAVVLSAAFLLAPGHGAASPIVAAGGATQQWAFGGHAATSYTCSQTACPDSENISSISVRYYVGWVVIYTATNVSSTVTEVEAQAAINASVSASVSACIQEAASGPCDQLSASASLNGRETATGFTNISDAATVNLSSGAGSPGTVAAWGILNAQSNASFNFSGSFSDTGTFNGTSASESITFDLGGSELSSLSFGSTPLGIVPLDPSPGQWWNASEPFSATGSYTSGYSLSEDIAGTSYSSGNWTSLSVSPSGTLGITGTDLGSYSLTDNYTSPPTSVTAQAILLNFNDGAFAGADGWLMLPSGLYGGAAGAVGGFDLIAGNHPALGTASVTGSESAYFEPGVGFVGVDESENSSALGVSGGPQFALTAGPEPVSVAQQQYQAITSSNSGGSSSFPWVLTILAVAVVLVVVVVALVLVRRSRRRPPNAAPVSVGGGPTPSSGPAAPEGPVDAAAPIAPSSAAVAAAAVAPAGGAAAAPVCPSCGQPATFVAEYGRYYCYTDKRYL